MAVNLTFECATVAELHAEMLSLLGKKRDNEIANLEKIAPHILATPAPAVAETSSPVVVTTEAPAKRRGRPPAAAKVEPVKEVEDANPVRADEPEASEPAAEETSNFTLDDVKKALGKVRDTKGMQSALALLADFGGKKLSDVSSDDYAAFIVKAQTYLED